MRFGSRLLAAATLLAGLTLGQARAQTVDEIVSRGTINIGVLVDLPPYGLLNDKQEPDGYDIEVAKLIGQYMGVKVNIVPLTSPNRIPFLASLVFLIVAAFLLTNKVDLLVATFGITPERAKQVMFSIPYAAIENVIFAPKDKHIAVLDDLKGLRVGVPRGSVQDVLLTLHRVRHTYDPDRPLLPWVAAIVHRRAVDAIRRRSRTSKWEEGGSDRYETYADPAANRQAAGEDGQWLARAVATLSWLESRLRSESSSVWKSISPARYCERA